MEPDELQDLIEGRNEWQNVQDILRITFKRFNDMMNQQSQQFLNLHREFVDFRLMTEQQHEKLKKKIEKMELIEHRHSTLIEDLRVVQHREDKSSSASEVLLLKYYGINTI
jgi:uncharacterized coiled-coil DUF342 family protein